MDSMRTNRYLPDCFSHNVDVFRIENRLFLRFPLLKTMVCRQILFWLQFACIFKEKNQVIEFKNAFDMLSLSNNSLLYGDEKLGKTRIYKDYTGYLHLLTNRFGKSPKLPKHMLSKCKSEIKKKIPSFHLKPFVALHLRKKGRSSKLFHDRFRCSGNQTNYVASVEYLLANGFNVIASGETDIETFRGLEGVYNLGDIDLPAELLNIYVLSNCAGFIGQHSGPQNFVVSCGLPVLLCDAMPFFHGTFNPQNRILRKN